MTVRTVDCVVNEVASDVFGVRSFVRLGMIYEAGEISWMITRRIGDDYAADYCGF